MCKTQNQPLSSGHPVIPSGARLTAKGTGEPASTHSLGLSQHSRVTNLVIPKPQAHFPAHLLSCELAPQTAFTGNCQHLQSPVPQPPASLLLSSHPSQTHPPFQASAKTHKNPIPSLRPPSLYLPTSLRPSSFLPSTSVQFPGHYQMSYRPPDNSISADRHVLNRIPRKQNRWGCF